MKGYRTLLLNVLTMLAGAGSLGGAIPEDAAPYVLLVAGVANVVLRFFTNTPVGSANPALYGLLVPLLLVGAVGLSGCSYLGLKQPSPSDCATLAIAANARISMLLPKCQKAPDPSTDEACIEIQAERAIVAACVAQMEPPPAPA